MSTLKLALLTGGYSEEASVSYKSADNVLKHIDNSKYTVYPIHIKPSGWTFTNSFGNEISVNKNDFTLVVDGTKIRFDVAFVCIHGTPAEDGRLQAYLDDVNIPHTACSVTASAVTFDKWLAKTVAAYAGFNTAPCVLVRKKTAISSKKIIEELGLPVFVKPNSGGSSIGITKVTKEEQLLPAIHMAQKFDLDQNVLIEHFIEGIELTVGVYATGSTLVVLPITEVSTERNFFDFEAKYTPGLSQEITPARIDTAVEELVNKTSRKLYETYNCKGLIRIDFIYQQLSNQLFVLEINTVPGLTVNSLVPKQLETAGIPLSTFFSILIDEALKNHHEA